jgi:HK97 family phage major capsid protein
VSDVIANIRRAREGAQQRAEDLIASARTEQRSLTAIEVAELEGLSADIDAATSRIEQLAERQYSLAHAERAAAELPTNRPPQRPTHVLTRSDSLVEHLERSGAPRVDDFDLGRMVRAMATGDWGSAEVEHRAMSGSVSANGGVALPTLVSSDIIDRARAISRVMQAGAVTVPMPSASYRLPQLDTDPSAAWRNELAAINDSTPTMSGLDLTARSLACLVRVSVELFEDVPTLGDFLLGALGEAFGVEYDRVALYGTGTAPEPRGLLNTAGLTTTTVGTGNGTDAATLRSDWHINAVAACRAANFEPTATILHPQLLARMQRSLTTANDYVSMPAGLPPALHTSQVRTSLTVGSSADCSEAFTGDFSRLVMGVRSNLTIRLLTERWADTNEIGLVATMRADIGVTRAAAFVRTAGLRLL